MAYATAIGSRVFMRWLSLVVVYVCARARDTNLNINTYSHFERLISLIEFKFNPRSSDKMQADRIRAITVVVVVVERVNRLRYNRCCWALSIASIAFNAFPYSLNWWHAFLSISCALIFAVFFSALLLFHASSAASSVHCPRRHEQNEMVSRRKILSRSRDDLNMEQPPYVPEEEEDVWYQKDKLFKVCMQRNRIVLCSVN